MKEPLGMNPNVHSSKSIGVSVKFEILTRQKLKQELPKYGGPSIMVLTTNTHVDECGQDCVSIIVEDQLMGE